MGYSASDVITTLFRVVKNHPMNEYLKLEYIKVCWGGVGWGGVGWGGVGWGGPM